MSFSGNDKSSRKKKINYSSSFRNSHESISRDDELRHSTGSVRAPYGVRTSNKAALTSSNRRRVDKGTVVHLQEASVGNRRRRDSHEPPMSDKDEHNTSSHSVSHLIKGFESKTEHSRYEPNSFLTPNFGSYGDQLDGDVSEKHKRNSSKRKLSIRRRGKGNHDANITVLQKLGIAPFMGSENRNAKKSLAHFDIQSVLFDIENASTLKSVYEDGGGRPRNISTGASAASMRSRNKNAESGNDGKVTEAHADSVLDNGDGASNELVESCPYFRNELGSVQSSDESKREKLLRRFDGNVSARIWTSASKNRAPSLELLHSTDNDIDTLFGRSVELNDLAQKKNITLLEAVDDDSKITLWDRAKNSFEKRVFEFEHIDLGALYYRNYFVGKDHQTYLGIDEKYGPISISIIRENILKMAVLGHLKESIKGGSNKYQYRIILRSTDLQTFRGTALEDSIPSTTRHGTSRALPARDILEFCFPELQINCLKTAVTGPKVPEHLLKLDEQQLSLQFKVGLLYCKAGQKSEEDMYNNEHHGPAFDEFMDVIGEKVFLKGFEGYRAQLDNKNDSTGTYSVYTKFQNREIMFHVSTLLPWTPNNRQQLLRKRHIGNDIVTVIFQEPGAEPFTPKNIRSHFQHVFIIVRVENPNTSNTSYRVAVSRSQDVPDFGPPIPPDSVFKSNKAFRDFLLSKVINAENAAHKSEKFTAMAIRTRYEYLKDLATNFVTTQGIDTGGAKFSKFNPMSLSVKKREKIHPPCSPEVWCQAGISWSVKVEVENATTSRLCFMAISTSFIALIDKVNKEIVAAIPCKSVIGWRNSGYSMRLYYNNGQGLNLTLVEDDGNEITFVVNRLKAVTPGCQTQDMSLRRSDNGQLGFHVFYEGLVAEVEPYGMAWQSGLRKGSRLLEINNRLVGKMSHDRMIQALRKPGNTRVVVLPPLPDGQPRNYKSTRNLKRYSSMTSVYSERLPESSDTSASSSSSTENIPKDFDVVTPIRVGRQKMTVVEARIKQNCKARSSSNHGSRPSGFILDSDQTLELTEASSGEHFVLSAGVPRDQDARVVARPRGINGLAKESNGWDRATESNALGKTTEKQSATDGKTLTSATDAKNKDGKSAAVPGSVDPELTELERTISDARKSIDAKFYQSLVQSSMVAQTGGNSIRSPDLTKSQTNVENTQWDAPMQQASNQENSGNSSELSPWSPSKRSLSPSGDSYTMAGMSEEAQLSASTQSGSAKGSNSSLNRMRSPPPYDEAITSLERRRGKKHTGTDKRERESRAAFRQIDTSETSGEEKPRCVSRNMNADRRKLRYQAKSENFEDLLGSGSSALSLTNHELNAPPYEFLGNRNKLMIARSESHIPSSCEKFAALSDGEEHRCNVNIVHTRVRDVNEIIQEKNHVRSESADQLTGFAALLPTPQRSSSADESRKTLVGRDMPWRLTRTPNGDDGFQGRPYSRHDARKGNCREKITGLVEDNDMQSKERKLSNSLVNKESAAAMLYHSLSRDDEVMTDTFARIDQAFGFTSYANEEARVDGAEERRRKSLKNRKPKPHVVLSDTSDEYDTSGSLSSVNSSKRISARRPRFRSFGKAQPPSQESLEKKKSEAEESLEAAITEFHSTLSNLPAKHSTEEYKQSLDKTPTPRDKGFSASAYFPSEESFSRDSFMLRRNSTAMSKSRRGDNDNSVNSIQVSRKRISYPDERSVGVIKSASRQASLDSVAHSHKGSGGRVQELVGKFSQQQQQERKGSLDSSLTKRAGDRGRSRSEARISLLASPSPWVRKSSNPIGSKTSEAGNIIRRFEKHRENHTEKGKQLNERVESETPSRKRISVKVRPKLDMEKCVEARGQSHVEPNSPSWNDACKRGTTTLPGRGRKANANGPKSVVDMPLSVRGLDLAPQRADELTTSSKEDLRLMLSVLSGELIKEKSENERLLEELQLARIEKETLLEESKRSASQLRKFTHWFYDSVSNKDTPPSVDQN